MHRFACTCGLVLAALVVFPGVPRASGQGKVDAPSDLRITVLGREEAKNDAFYLIEGEKKARTFDELTVRLKEQLEKGSLRGVEVRLTRTSPAKESPVVERLARWLRENGVKWSVLQD
jgi:hypothetical protein